MPSRQHEESRRHLHWQALAARFPGERECLASYLALELAEVLAGAKPANLLRISARTRPCGRNLARLWKKHGAELLEEAGIASLPLRRQEDGVLLLFYRPEAMDALFGRKNVRHFLFLCGYPEPVTADAALAHLACRFQGDAFPHEIGVFLGYPLKDVAGFLGWGRLPASGQGPWRIFGDPAKSLGLAETFRRCRCQMAERLTAGASPLVCLQPAAGLPQLSRPDRSWLEEAAVCVSR